MPKKAHTEEQIVAVLRQVEAGVRVDEVCRKVGISQATYYLWKRKNSGVGVSELRELGQLREEVGRLKRLVADLSLDRARDQPGLQHCNNIARGAKYGSGCPNSRRICCQGISFNARN